MNKEYLYGFLVLIVVVSILTSFFTFFYISPNITGKAVQDTGNVQVNVVAGLGIAIDTVYNVIDFGNIARDRTYDSDSADAIYQTPAITKPILIRNEGSIAVDVQICAENAFWSGSYIASDFQYKVDVPLLAGSDNCGSLVSNSCFTTLNSITTYTNLPFPIIPNPCTNVNAVNNLQNTDTNDEVELDIKIHVPVNEPTGAKSTTITITGVDPATIPL